MTEQTFSPRLREAIEVGMVLIEDYRKTATIMAPQSGLAGMTDGDVLLVLTAASEMIQELESLGYTVRA